MEMDWLQDENDWVVMDCDTSVVYGRYATETEALRVFTEYKWTGVLPAPESEKV